MLKNIIDFKKKPGFWVTLSSYVFLLIGLIGYLIFSGNQGKSYFSVTVIVITVIFLVVAIPLMLIKYTEKYAPVFIGAGAFAAMLIFISKSYMYLSEVFYSKIDIGLLFTNDAGYPIAIIGYFISFILASVAMYMKQGENEFYVQPKNGVQKSLYVSKIISKILLHVSVFIFSIVAVAYPILMNNSTSITTALGQETFIKVEYEDDGNTDTEYYKSSVDSIKKMKEKSAAIIQEAVEKGAVLLKNSNNCLPFAKNSTVSFFSASSIDLVNGRGSSSEISEDKATLKDGAVKAGLKVNETLWNWYVNNKSTYGRTTENDRFNMLFTLNDATWDKLPSAKTSGDEAVLVISRDAGEGVDPTWYGGAPTKNNNGNYLELSAVEKNLLTNLKSQFNKVCVILNCANEVQVDFDADAILWIGNVGSTGAYGVGNILAGNVNPSGHASDTFWKAHKYNPVLANFGATSYSNRVVPALNAISSYCPETTDAMMLKSNNYTVYQEGIYNGYRYTETRYEDYVLGKTNVGTFNYNDVVAYPFGYGTSYTKFAYSNFSVVKDETDGISSYNVSVTVKNTGTVAGADAVQIYLQKPYTSYDVTNKIEKSAVELVGFEKTNVLAANASQTVTINVPEEYFETYDAYGAKTYILEDGKYYLTAASDSHSAINNILLAKAISTEQKNKMTGNGDASLATSFTYTFDSTKYSKSLVTGKAITNQFDNADMNRYEGRGDNSVTYISRNNWLGTVKFGVDDSGNKLDNAVKFTGTDKMKEDMANPTIEKDNIAYPNYGSKKTAYSIVDFMSSGMAYDNPMWNDFLDQLTWDETVSLLSSAERSTGAVTSVNKKATLDYNGAIGPNYYNYKGKAVNGLAYKTNDPDKGSQPNQYVCNGIVASTFDKKFANEYGKVMGEDCLWAGYSGLYGPAVNIHRSAYGGRAFEYYSEDPILSGQVAASQIQGIQVNGVYCYVKHAIMNDAETMREGINIWANEQTIREIYLRPFEITIRDGKAPNVMSGFNRLGLKWNGHQGYLKKVLHEEFGMTGFAVSDWYDSRTWYMTSYCGLLNGNDMPDGSYASNKNSQCLLNNYKTGYGELAQAMRDACHRVLYTVAHSNAMNGLSSNVDIYTVTPAWIRLLKRTEKGCATALYITLALTGVTLAAYYTVVIVQDHKSKKGPKVKEAN